ncbi:MAG: DUF1707 SHOCT-like domain-containing protein [Micromonosporaceae bacterium]
MRAADIDRDRIVAELRDHTAAGRLSLDEFDTRAQAAYGSRTMGELASLTADLPALEPPADRPRRRAPTPMLYALAAILIAVAVLGVLGVVVGPAAAGGMDGMMNGAGMMNGMSGGCH